MSDRNDDSYVDFKDVKTGASVPVVLASLGLLDDLTSSGDELKGWCVLGDTDARHGKDDSFSFNVRKKIFKCFACKKRGSVLDFVAQYRGGWTLRQGAQYVQEVMDKAKDIAGADASEDALTQAVASTDEASQGTEKTYRRFEQETQSKELTEEELRAARALIAKRKKERSIPQEIEPIKVVQMSVDNPLSPADLQNAVMSWSLAEYRVRDGKLNPDELIVVDVSTLEFLRQLTAHA